MLATIIVFNSGCEQILPKRNDIEDLTIIKVIGIDKSDGKYRVTTVMRSPNIAGSKSSKGGQYDGGGGAADPKIIVTEGRTIFEAVRLMNTQSHREVFLGRTEHLIIGEEAARDNTRKIIDYFVRDFNLRLDINVFMVLGNTAQAIIEDTAEEPSFIGDTLTNFKESYGEASMSNKLTLADFAYRIDSKTSVPYIPSLLKIEGTHETGQGGPTPSIQMIGLGVLKEDRFKYYMDQQDTMAFNFITGDFKAGVIIVKDNTGQDVSLYIIKAKKKVKSVIKDENVEILIEIQTASVINEQHSIENIYIEEILKKLESKQEETIKQMVAEVIKKAQIQNTDVFGLGDMIYHQHPVKWRKIEDKWDKVFPEIKVSIKVDSIIKRTFIIEEPNEYQKKREER